MKPDALSVGGYFRPVAGRRGRPSTEEAVRALVATEAGSGSSHLERVVAALEVAAAADRLARIEVMAAREMDGASWTEVGKALGISRQAAHERFRTGPDGLHSRLYKRERPT